MRRALNAATLAALLIIATAPAAVAQAPAAASAQASLTTDLLRDIEQAEEKLLALGNALTEAQYDWRPAEGVRSVREALLHVAADNYFMPAIMGTAAPAETRITATEFTAVQAFEKQPLGRAATIAALEQSFDHLSEFIGGVPESRMDETIAAFGQEFTTRGFLIITATHLHEHLGQLIAYARMNGVTPPWSR